jgi:hypothetical protein
MGGYLAIARILYIRFHRNPFTEQLPSDSPGIGDVFTGCYQATVTVHRVTAQPQYLIPQIRNRKRTSCHIIL